MSNSLFRKPRANARRLKCQGFSGRCLRHIPQSAGYHLNAGLKIAHVEEGAAFMVLELGESFHEQLGRLFRRHLFRFLNSSD